MFSKLVLTKIKSIDSVTVTNFVMPVYSGGFSRDGFWEEFSKIHSVSDEKELLEIVLDVSRSHWSPKIANWPGMELTVKCGTEVFNIVLPPGKSKCHNFSKTSNYNWTAACLATAAIYHQYYGTNKDCTTLPNGNHNGATQFCSTIDGFEEADLTNCENAFDQWLASVGQKKRDANVTVRIKAAARKTISDRKPGTSAYSLINTLRILVGEKFEIKDQYKIP